MKWIVGSTNDAKVGAVRDAVIDGEIIGSAVSSDVSEQPVTDDETIRGAINRAHYAKEKGDVGIGLEGGVRLIGDRTFVTNWGALVTQEGRVYVASGPSFELPPFFARQLELGEELGVVLGRWKHDEQVRSKEGASGIFTNGRLLRRDMYRIVVETLIGQWEFDQQSNGSFANGSL